MTVSLLHPLELSVSRRVTGLAPAEHRIVVLPGGFKMNVLAINPGAPAAVLFLHGVGGSPDLLRHPLSSLARKHNVTIYAPYLPCHGSSDDVDSFPELLDVMGQTAEQLGLQNSVFIGHSLGAHIVMRLAESRPDLISAGVALAMPTKIHTAGARFFATMPALGLDALVTSNIAFLGSLFTGNPFELASAFVDAGFRVANGKTIFDVLKGASDLRDVMPQVDQPFTLVYGGLDSVVRPIKFKLGANFKQVVLHGMPHNFLWLPPTVIPTVSAALAEALGVVRSQPLAQVIHLPVRPLSVALSS